MYMWCKLDWWRLEILFFPSFQLFAKESFWKGYNLLVIFLLPGAPRSDTILKYKLTLSEVELDKKDLKRDACVNCGLSTILPTMISDASREFL